MLGVSRAERVAARGEYWRHSKASSFNFRLMVHSQSKVLMISREMHKNTGSCAGQREVSGCAEARRDVVVVSVAHGLYA